MKGGIQDLPVQNYKHLNINLQHDYLQKQKQKKPITTILRVNKTNTLTSSFQQDQFSIKKETAKPNCPNTQHSDAS